MNSPTHPTFNPVSTRPAGDGHGTRALEARLDSDRPRLWQALASRAAYRMCSFFALLGVALIAACTDEVPTEVSVGDQQPALSIAGGVLVSNLEVASGRDYRVVNGGLAEGAKQYIDRRYPLRSTPDHLEGLTYIRTANNDQYRNGSGDFLSFSVDRNVVVYVAYEAGEPLPSWLRNSFTATSLDLIHEKSNSQKRFKLYKKSYPAGRVALGSNRGSGGDADMYSVIIKPIESSSSSPSEPSSSGFGDVVDGIRPRGYWGGTYNLRQPAAGGTMYYVAPGGSNTNPGTSSRPFRTINKAARVARAGDVVTIRAGTYRETVKVQHAGTADKPIVFQAVQRGKVVLTGGSHHFVPDNWTSGMKQSGPVYVTLRGLIFRDYAPDSNVNSRYQAAVGAIRGWRIENCLFDRAGHNGLDIRGNSVTVVRSTFQYHHTNAMTAWAPRGSNLYNIRVADVVLRGNNTRSNTLWGSASAKVVKFYRTSGAVIDNIESYENNGPGFWFDTQNTDFTVRNSYFHHNRGRSGRGLFIEINLGPGRIENNVFAHNAMMGLALANSQGVEVIGNLFVGNDRSIALMNADRGSAYPLKDITIRGNYFKGWNDASAIHPGGNLTTPGRMNITANYNTYDPGSVARLSWWPNKGWARTIREMQNKLGWENSGRIGSIAWPQ